MRYSRSVALLLVAVAALVSCGPRRAAQRAPSTFRVTFLDVGQGDATLIRTPENDTVLIDTGPGSRIVRLLQREGISRIDLLILTHGHKDHTGGYGALVQAMTIGETWVSGALMKKRRSISDAEPVFAGKRKSMHALELTVLHPDETPQPRRRRRGEVSENDKSIVVKASYGDTSYLIPGDCELGCWEELFREHRSELRATVLKAAHHGSNNGTNSGVLINVRPKIFVISCGKDNDFHHPHPIVLKLAEKSGAEILRTDEQGAITCAGDACAPAREP